MPVASMTVLPAAASNSAMRKSSLAPEKKYKCQFCNRAFSRSEHRSRHERSRKSPYNSCGRNVDVLRSPTINFCFESFPSFSRSGRVHQTASHQNNYHRIAMSRQVVVFNNSITFHDQYSMNVANMSQTPRSDRSSA